MFANAGNKTFTFCSYMLGFCNIKSCVCKYKLGMHDIIGLISESTDNVFKCKYRHRPDMNNYADMSCR